MCIYIIYQQHERWKGILKRVATHAALQLRMHANVNTARRKAYKMLQDAGVAPILQTETQRGYTYNHNEHNSCIPRMGCATTTRIWQPGDSQGGGEDTSADMDA